MALRGKIIALAFGLLLAGSATPALAFQTEREILIKDRYNRASGFYTVPWHVGRFLNEDEIETKIRDRRYVPRPPNLPMRVRNTWVIVPYCDQGPDARGRRTLTSSSESPFEVTCP